jgi:hypothetical protein
MRRWIITAVAAVIVVVLVTGYIGLTYNNKPAANPAEAARDATMNYLADTYWETQAFTANLSWSGGKQATDSAGIETYVYTTPQWTITLNGSKVSNPLYIIDANYTNTDVTLEWAGVCQNGTIVERGLITYEINFENPPAKEALWGCFPYLLDTHNETQPYQQNILGWTGGAVPNPEGFVGSQTYRYSAVGWNQTSMYSAGWTITVQYPIVPNPIYNVNITSVWPHDASGSIIIDWQGTWQDGTVTETSYTHAQTMPEVPEPAL